MTGALASRDLTRPLAFWPTVRGVFSLSLEGMVWSRRSLLMAVLLGLPVILAILYRVVLAVQVPSKLHAVSGFDLYGAVVTFYYLRNVLPLAALFYATALIADEVEWKTITYLLTRPLRRGAILVGKFVAYLATTLSLTLPPLVATFFILTTAGGFRGVGGHVADLFRDMGVAALAFLSYGALFSFMGVLLRRPLIPGLLFLFVWELVANLPGYLPRFTITVYLRSLIRHRPPAEGLGEIFGQVLPTLLCLEVLAVLIAVFLAGAAWIFSSREYVMEQ